MDTKSVFNDPAPCGLLVPIELLNLPVHKKVLFLTKLGLTKYYKGLIFVSEKAWAPCIQIGGMTMY